MKNTKPAVIVFGATGNLGAYLMDALLEKGFNVFACARRNADPKRFESIGVEGASVDIVSKSGFDKLPKENVHAVVQIAGAMPSRMAGYKPQTYIDVNLTGTMNVLEYARSVGAGRYIYMQSHSDVYGHWNTGRPIPADATRSINYKGDHAVYIISKNAAVDLAEHYHQEYNLRTITLRLPTIYCYTPIKEMYVNGQKKPIAYLYMIDRALRGDPVEIWGDPKIKKDIVYVKDYTQVVIGAINSDKAQGMYNVGTGVGTSLEEQIKGIIAVFSPGNKTSQLIYMPDKPSQAGFVYDISKTRQDLGYTPRYYYMDMLMDMKNEMISSRHKYLSDSNLMI